MTCYAGDSAKWRQITQSQIGDHLRLVSAARVAGNVKHAVKQNRHGAERAREERSMAESMAGSEHIGSELLQDSVSRTLAIEMLDGVWKAGDSLTLEDLQSRFGISRTVAREVAKTLESMNAVLVKRRIGLVARPFDEWQALNHQVIEWRLHSTQRGSLPSTSRRNSLCSRRECGRSPKPTKRVKRGSRNSMILTWNSIR